MYKISELAKKVGLSRTALLYYEKQKLISGQRLQNGYRVYSDKDLQRIRLIQQLQAGGLTLAECKVCLEAKLDKALLVNRLKALDEEIEKKRRSRELLAGLLGEKDLKAWHQDLDKLAPDAHIEWLTTQGFNEKEALRLKWLSKDMNDHDAYMNDFMNIYDTLERWGPGSDEDTRKALSHVTGSPRDILDIGCGKGLATKVLLAATEAHITAVDNEQSALDCLAQIAGNQALSARIKTVCASMTALPFSKESFDLIWSEGSAYIMGVENALIQWQPFLRKQGHLVFSDMVWRSTTPSEPSMALWKSEYPDMQTVQTRLEQIQKAGYHVIHHFPQSQTSWDNYYGPLGDRLTELEPMLSDKQAYLDIKNEFEICTRYANEFGYEMFVLAKA